MGDTSGPAPEPAADPVPTRFGVVALTGRPNAGKSTLLNRVLGHKVSIVSDKPQTTRNRIVGILNDPRGQIAFLDTPGIHKPLHRMNVRMMDHVRSALAEADLTAVIVDATAEFGHGDEFVLEMLGEVAARRILLLNKIDRIRKEQLLPLLDRYGRTALFEELIPISAATGDGVPQLVDLLFRALPSGAPRFPSEDFTTQPERFYAAEIVREKLLHHTAQELPYTTAVGVEKWEEDEERNLIRIWATIFVERDSQKKIVIGKGGGMIKRIGTEARQELESTLGTRIYLDLHVAVREQWREDERFLGELEWPLG
ncbi:MAG TPA: GTPase Era [Thermoanaerobaculia bacterium]|nr:GTPase Era [Thermoanaerobaculia bacterium]